jgi:hypothetical protein
LSALGVTLIRMLSGQYPYGEIEPFSKPRFTRTPASISDLPSLLSGQNPNKFSWFSSCKFLDLSASRENAVWISIFSNTVTEKTCSNV